MRVVGDHCYVTYSDLGGLDARPIVAEQARFFRELRREVEWKVYGHDRPSNLGALLEAEGFAPEPQETLMSYDLERGLPDASAPPDTDVRQVRDLKGLAEAVGVSEEAFGQGAGWRLEEYSSRLSNPEMAIFVVYSAGRPVSAARLEMPRGQSFASLWGGGTAPEYRHRGIYRHVVQVRAELARRRGYRFLTVDAAPTSRPILERMGFLGLTGIVGWCLRPARTNE